MMNANLLIKIILVISSLSCQFSKFLASESSNKIIANAYLSSPFNFQSSRKYSIIVKIEESVTPNAIASAEYETSLYTKGWDFLQLSSSEVPITKYNDEIKSYAMGFLEGYITQERMWNHYMNMRQYIFPVDKYPNNTTPEHVKEYLALNNEWIRTTSKAYREKDEYWNQAYLIQMQYEGLVDGYNSRLGQGEESKFFTYEEFQVMNAFGDLFDIPNYKKVNLTDFSKMTLSHLDDYIDRNTHCSSIIKLADDFSDLFLSHNTWFSFLTMTRIFKEYRYQHSRGSKPYTVAFSGYPGTLSSVDDFYLTNNLLYVAETTNPNLNTDLFKLLTPESLLTWMRVMIANRLADNSKQWTEVFIQNNSGTYNNQFMIVDFKKINLQDKTFDKDTFWIIEQLPGYSKSADMTEHLLQNKYWGSYNTPYFAEVQNKSGIADMLKSKPELVDTLDHEQCARANIFRREQNKIFTIEDMRKLMRLNNYKNDPLSKANPGLAISSRKDLDETKQSCSGAMDTKLVSYKHLMEKNTIDIISGPTTDNQPAFEPTTTQCNREGKLTFYGFTDKYEYEWIEYATKTLFK